MAIASTSSLRCKCLAVDRHDAEDWARMKVNAQRARHSICPRRSEQRTEYGTQQKCTGLQASPLPEDLSAKLAGELISEVKAMRGSLSYISKGHAAAKLPARSLALPGACT